MKYLAKVLLSKESGAKVSQMFDTEKEAYDFVFEMDGDLISVHPFNPSNYHYPLHLLNFNIAFSSRIKEDSDV